MRIDAKLIELIKSKNFKTFWHCLDYLLNAGYNNIEAFGIALKEYEGKDIFNNVAFGRIDQNNSTYLDPSTGHYGGSTDRVIIGLIDDSNIHLDGMYKLYREWILDEKFGTQLDIESTCEIITLDGLGGFLTTHLIAISEKHFGKPLFPLPRTGNRAPTAISRLLPRPMLPQPNVPMTGTDESIYRKIIGDAAIEYEKRKIERDKGDIWMSR